MALGFVPNTVLHGVVATFFMMDSTSKSIRTTTLQWWRVQVGSPGEGDEGPASLYITFYEGYPISALREVAGGPDAPEFYNIINGAYPDGEVIAYTIPASSASVTYDGEAVNGQWSGAGKFHNAADLFTFTVTLDAPDHGISGTLEKSDSPGHFGCNSTTSPYLDTILPAGTPLSENEVMFFKRLGWATSQPGGAATADVVLNGTAFSFAGKGYHDQNWMPRPADAFLDDWYFLNAQAGPYDLSAVLAAVTGSARDTTTGFLVRDGVVLQNQCGLQGPRDRDALVPAPWDAAPDEANGLASLILDQAIYHRWVGSAVGGKAGGEQYTGVSQDDWLNPSLRPYNG
ncbi:hypothetical protein BD413DRAFT_614305 [Trametes elegans]|nr:hypothetical protein BD413DRAFT_614305 [Trametes elegans]